MNGGDRNLELLSTLINANFTSLIVNFEKTDHYGVVEVYLIVTKEIIDYTKDMGPVDAIKLVLNNNMIYHCYIYLEIFEEGSLTQPHDICTLPLIQK